MAICGRTALCMMAYAAANKVRVLARLKGAYEQLSPFRQSTANPTDWFEAACLHRRALCFILRFPR
jgi:hypothetical protein